MKVALTGATGFIGSHVLTEVQKHGHEVTALLRGGAQADAVAARGVNPTVVDLYDRPAVANLLRQADAAIHTASPGDATAADMDSAVADAVIDAFSGTGKPYLQISGLWEYGANSAISEESPFNPPAMVAWKEPIERRVLGVGGMRGIVIVSSVAYEARARLGDYFAEVLLLDQATVAAKARADLGWQPTHPGLVDEFRNGSYGSVAGPARRG